MTTAKPQHIRPPSHLSRAEKTSFTRIAKQVTADETALNAAQVDLICDLIAARARITALRKMMDDHIAANSTFDTDKARILTLNGQINTTTSLAHRIADRLGFVSENKKG